MVDYGSVENDNQVYMNLWCFALKMVNTSIIYLWLTFQIDCIILCLLDNIKINIKTCKTISGFCLPGMVYLTCIMNWTFSVCLVLAFSDNVNNCRPVNPCTNGGHCFDGVNTFYCACTNGFMGTTCKQSKRLA